MRTILVFTFLIATLSRALTYPQAPKQNELLPLAFSRIVRTCLYKNYKYQHSFTAETYIYVSK